MNAKLELAQHKFIEHIGKLCDSFGLNKFVAQLYAVLYLSDKPLSLDDMVERLKVSKGNVSLNIRKLEKWGAVRNVWVKGSRKDFYEAELDIKKVVLNKVKSGVEKRISQVSNLLQEFNDIVESESGNMAEEEKRIAVLYKERMKKIDEMRSLALSGLSLADKLLR